MRRCAWLLNGMCQYRPRGAVTGASGLRLTSIHTKSVLDVVVIGAGPVGLACAIETRRHGLASRVIEKGALVNSIVGYPAHMEFFSTPELIEIGGYPFPVQGYKPTREEAIEYYRGVAAREALDVRLYERVLAVEGEAGTSRSAPRAASTRPPRRRVTGFFDQPNRLDVPGEELPKVTHYYREPYRLRRARRWRSSAPRTPRPRPRSTATATERT